MRFHKFETPAEQSGEAWVDLDRIHAIMPDPLRPSRTICATPSGAITVRMPVDEVLQLISPPAAPDTYEEDLAATHEAIGEGMRAAIRRHDAERRAEAMRNMRDMSGKPPVDELVIIETRSGNAPPLRTVHNPKAATRLDELSRIERAIGFRPGVLDYTRDRRREVIAEVVEQQGED